MSNYKKENKQLTIDTALVQRLVATQFSKWKDLTIRPVALSGWDNRTFHLGDDMLVRMPSAREYAAQVEKEQYWLPRLAPLLPPPIPEPLAIGEPAAGYPYKWSIYKWLEGESATTAQIGDLLEFAIGLAEFLIALQRIDPADGPLPGPHNFYRGGALTIYDAETRRAIAALKDKVNVDVATKVWEIALATTWHGSPVWIHGDMSAGNLLVKQGRLSGVIDFGQSGVGDPACDVTIAWTLFRGERRKIFRAKLSLDDETWARGRAWALWKALIIAAGFTNPNNIESSQCWHIIDEVLADHR